MLLPTNEFCENRNPTKVDKRALDVDKKNWIKMAAIMIITNKKGWLFSLFLKNCRLKLKFVSLWFMAVRYQEVPKGCIG